MYALLRTRKIHRNLGRLVFLSIAAVVLHLVWDRKLWGGGHPSRHEFDLGSQECPNLVHQSRYRQDPDYKVERELELHLLQIQYEQEMEGDVKYPVRKIWQTWRDRSPPEGFDRPESWTGLNPGWEHRV